MLLVLEERFVKEICRSTSLNVLLRDVDHSMSRGRFAQVLFKVLPDRCIGSELFRAGKVPMESL